MVGTTRFVEQRLKLHVNHNKSVVGEARRQPLLGFCFFDRDGEVKVRLAPDTRKRAKERLRQLTSRRWGVSMERRIREINRFTIGWTAYFALADTPSVFEELDEWLRRRLRQNRWKEWKRYHTKQRNLTALGIPKQKAREWASSHKGYWRIAGSAPLQRALPNAYWAAQGLHAITDSYHHFRDATRTAGCGPARPVVWGAPG
jgi:RNA-directed DNA polymerase